MVREIAADVPSEFSVNRGRIDPRIEITFGRIEAPDEVNAAENVRLDEGKKQILSDARIALTSWAKEIVCQRDAIVGMVAYKRDGADAREWAFVDSQAQPPGAQNIRRHLSLRIAMLSIKRLQIKNRVVGICVVESILLNCLNLAGDSLAQLAFAKGRGTCELELKLATLLRRWGIRASARARAQAVVQTPAVDWSGQGPAPPMREPLSKPEPGRFASFESHEVLDLAAEITANIQPADKDELIRERNGEGRCLFARFWIRRTELKSDSAEK